MSFQALAAAMLLFLWATLGIVPWLVLAAARRGRGVLLALPLSVAGGILGGLLVPALGLRDERGLLLSMPFALAGGLLFTVAGIHWISPAVRKSR